MRGVWCLRRRQVFGLKGMTARTGLVCRSALARASQDTCATKSQNLQGLDLNERHSGSVYVEAVNP